MKKKVRRAPASTSVAKVLATTSLVKAAILPKTKKIVKESVVVFQSGTKPGQIIWIVDLIVLLLLEIVIQVGAHITSHKNSATKWSEVHAIFFDREECIEYKTEVFYKKGEYRKLWDKFTKIMKSIRDDIDTGNQSGKYGEMSKVYDLVQQVERERDDDREN